MGPPDYLVINQGPTYTSDEMNEWVKAFGISLDEKSIESQFAIGTVERYYAPLRFAYKTFWAYMDPQTSEKQRIPFAVFVVNCKVSIKGLSPALIVFGAIPRQVRIIPASSQMKRAQMIDLSVEEVAWKQARRKFAFGVRPIGGPKGTVHFKSLK